jgi:hypothetical protein
MAKKIIIGIIIAAVILLSTGALLYANPKEHPNKDNHKYLNTENDLNVKNKQDESKKTDNIENDNKNTINITSNGYNISILPPIGINNQKAFKKGRTIPVKFILTDTNGNIVENMSIMLYLAKVENNVVVSQIQATSPGKSNNGNYFRFDKVSKMCVFNLSTKNLSAGTWRLIIDLGNGTIFNTDIILR